MENQTMIDETTRSENTNDTITAGVILIGLGVLFLIGQVFDLGLLFLLIPGVGMLGYGILKREAGWMVPGGILIGIGTGIMAMESPVFASFDEGSIFLLAFSAGFILVTISSLVFSDSPQWWALIPGGIMALVALAVNNGGLWLDLVELLGRFWPVILIIAGISALVGGLRGRRAVEPR